MGAWWLQSLDGYTAAGTLYFMGIPVMIGDVITFSDPSLLTFDPPDGPGTYVFNYTEVDAANQGSATPNTATMIFTDLTISGTVYNDADGDVINGTATNTIGSNTLYANLVNATGDVVASVPVNADGT